jgi:hypothetical protein
MLPEFLEKVIHISSYFALVSVKEDVAVGHFFFVYIVIKNGLVTRYGTYLLFFSYAGHSQFNTSQILYPKLFQPVHSCFQEIAIGTALGLQKIACNVAVYVLKNAMMRRPFIYVVITYFYIEILLISPVISCRSQLDWRDNGSCINRFLFCSCGGVFKGRRICWAVYQWSKEKSNHDVRACRDDLK